MKRFTRVGKPPLRYVDEVPDLTERETGPNMDSTRIDSVEEVGKSPNPKRPRLAKPVLKKRDCGLEVIYKEMRRTMGILSAKINTLSEGVKTIKNTEGNRRWEKQQYSREWQKPTTGRTTAAVNEIGGEVEA